MQVYGSGLSIPVVKLTVQDEGVSNKTTEAPQNSHITPAGYKGTVAVQTSYLVNSASTNSR